MVIFGDKKTSPLRLGRSVNYAVPPNFSRAPKKAPALFRPVTEPARRGLPAGARPSAPPLGKELPAARRAPGFQPQAQGLCRVETVVLSFVAAFPPSYHKPGRHARRQGQNLRFSPGFFQVFPGKGPYDACFLWKTIRTGYLPSRSPWAMIDPAARTRFLNL